MRNRKYSFLATCIVIAISSVNQAVAACDMTQPGTDESVLCDAGSPGNTPVVSMSGVTGVSVTVAQNGELIVSGADAISLGDKSTVINNGTVSGNSAMILRDGSSVITNNGILIGLNNAAVIFNGSGNNTLSNSGTITGKAGGSAVIFGSGDSVFEMSSGTVNGGITSGDGADKIRITGGLINGNISQGKGIDDFFMSGGKIVGSVQQGDGRDTFFMSGGEITGAFEDGDVAIMTGGKIGRVDLKLDNNIFDMSGGEIAGNLVAGFGNDIINISGDSIVGGNVSVSGGTDVVTVTGGTIKGEVRMSTGDDIFHWEKGNILGAVLMGNDNDRIEFKNLDLVSAATSPLIDGGTGDDLLNMDNSRYIHGDKNKLQGIEHIELTNHSVLTLKNNILKLGDAADDNSSTGYFIDGTSTLDIQHNSALAFTGHIKGTGTLSVDTGGNTFDFTTNNVNDKFEGTLALSNSRFDLSGLNTDASEKVTLKAGTGSEITVGRGTQHIGGLTFDGGTVDFGRVAPGHTTADNTVQTRGDLNLNGSGTVKAGVDDMLHTLPGVTDTVPLLSQDDANALIKLAGSDGTVTGHGGSLTLADEHGNAITDGVSRDIIQDGLTAAKGTWDWRLSAGEHQDGLYIAYALKEVELLGSGSDALRLDSLGATGNAADLSARLTGSGDLVISDSGGGTVSLSNRDNDYTGITDVRSGTLLMNNDNVLGKTVRLNLADDTALKMNGYTQTIGEIHSAAASQIALNGGHLTIENGGTIGGRLSGGGKLTFNSGVLDIHGANTALSADTKILGGAVVNLNNAAGLGSGSIDHAGQLTLSGADGMLKNSLSNNGAVDLNHSAIILSGNNSGFSGRFTIDQDSHLSAGSAAHLGSAVINNAGQLTLTTGSDWTLDNLVTGNGSLVKNGSGALTLTAASVGYTGKTDISGGGIIFGDRANPLALESSEITINHGYLAGNGTVAGDVINKDRLRVGYDDPDAAAGTDSLVIGGNLINSGRIQAGQTGSNIRAGNSLTVNGDYTGDNGKIHFNTALGGDNSVTDRMVISGNSSGTTHVSVTNAGGIGAKTLNGIELISVAGNSAGEFVQDGRIVAGAYDYRLTRGADSQHGNWYLTNDADDPTGPAGPVLPPEGKSMLRAEAGNYIANQAAAAEMFSLRLHDRPKVTYYTDILTGEKRETSLWLRQTGSHTGARTNTGSLKTTANQYVVMLGGDVAQWSHNGTDRASVGLMAGYGNNHNRSSSGITGHTSKGRTDGYSAGLYGTWFENDAEQTGLYADTWVQYSWFKNSVTGRGLAEEKYDADGFSASLEGGYSLKAGEFRDSKDGVNTVYIRPQAQVTWSGIKADDHTERNGTLIRGDNSSNIQTRLGARVQVKGRSDFNREKQQAFEPFVEVNWLHNTHDWQTDMNGVKISQQGARDIGEIKTGIEGQLSRNLITAGEITQQLGNNGYHNTQVMLGVKYSF